MKARLYWHCVGMRNLPVRIIKRAIIASFAALAVIGLAAFLAPPLLHRHAIEELRNNGWEVWTSPQSPRGLAEKIRSAIFGSRNVAKEVSGPDVMENGTEGRFETVETWIRWLPELMSVRLDRAPSERSGLDFLRHCRNLKSLWIIGNVTDEMLSVLRFVPQLEHLSLDSPKVTDDGLVHMCGLSRLNVLRLPATSISGKCFEDWPQSEVTLLDLGGTHS